MPYLTPSLPAAPTQYMCRRLRFPADFDLLLAVKGAVLELTKSYNWEQFGTSTPDEMAAVMQGVYDDFVFSEGCMIGTIVPYVTNDPPPHTLPCDGSQYDRVDYPDLYELLLPALIVDADHFVTPDLRDLFTVGVGTDYEPLDTGGEESVYLTIGEMPEHTHVAQPHYHSEIAAELVFINGGLEAPSISARPAAAITGQTVVTLNPTGGSGDHENRPPYIALPYCIVAR